MPIECDEGHPLRKVVYRRPAAMPKEVKRLRYLMVLGVLLTLANLVTLAGALSGVSATSAQMLEAMEGLRAEDGAAEVVVLADIVRAFDNLVIFLLVGAVVGVLAVVARYVQLLRKGFSAGNPATYAAIRGIAKVQLMVLALTVLGPALVFAGNEVVSFSPAFSVSMVLPFGILHFLRKPAVKSYFSVYEVEAGPHLPAAALVQDADPGEPAAAPPA